MDYKIHCHCFTSNYDSALKWTSRFENLFIGLTPLVTYRSAVDTHEVARLLPLDKLLLETDAPYFLPCGFDVSDMTVCDMTVSNVEMDAPYFRSCCFDVSDVTVGNMEWI